MSTIFSRDLPRALGFLAVALGIGALVLRDPATSRRASVDLAALAQEVESGADHVDVKELREIVKGKRARIVDLRSSQEFAAGHIPEAENVPLARLHELKVRNDEPVVLYSVGGIHSAQAWVFLRARGIKSVRFLVAGYDEWKDAENPVPAAPVPVAETTPTPAAAPLQPRAAAPADVHMPDSKRGLIKAANASPVPPKVEAKAVTTPAPATTALAKKPREGC